ncbi:WD40 repeat domain-containing protein [Dactylosporangium sp. CA-092794]|uniref:WD40 repeat domain-containing protein n=1 Tax=Dactylosporangium sp. CA-092794 TaxID=3239929 RepID=UPI003D8C8EED
MTGDEDVVRRFRVVYQAVGTPTCLAVGGVAGGGAVAVAGRDAAVEVLDLASGEPVQVFGTGIDYLESIAVAELDGRPVAVCADRRCVRVFDIATGALVAEPVPADEEYLWAVATAAVAGRPVVVTAGSDGLLRLRDLTTGEAAGEPVAGLGASRLAVAALDGRAVAVAGGRDGVLRVVDLAAGTVAAVSPAADAGAIVAVAVGAAGGRPVVVSAADGERVLRVHDLATGAAVGEPIPLPRGPVAALAVAEVGGRPVAAGVAGAAVWLWDIATGEAVGEPLAHPDRVEALALARVGDGAMLVSAALDDAVRVWQLPGGVPVGTPSRGGSSPVTALTAGSAGGRVVAVSGHDDGALRRWDLTALAPVGPPLIGHEGAIDGLALVELDGRPAVVSAADTTVRVWDLATGDPLRAPIDAGPRTRVMGAARWKDRTILVCLGDDGRARVWDLDTGELAAGPMDDWAGAHAFVYHGGVVHAVVEDHPYDSDADDYDFDEIALQVWDFAEGTQVGAPLIGGGVGGNVMRPPVTIAGLGTGPVLLSGAGADGRLRVWDLTTGTAVSRPPARHRGQLTALAVLAPGAHPHAVTGGRDGTLRTWDLSTGDPVGDPVTAHHGTVTAIATAGADGRALVLSAGTDATIRVWDWTGGTGTAVAALVRLDGAGWARLHADGTHEIHGDPGGRFRLSGQEPGPATA